MFPGRRSVLTRRAFSAALGRLSGAIGVGAVVSPVVTAQVAAIPDLRDPALRGLAQAAWRGDPALAAAAETALAHLARTDPEGALLAQIYRLHEPRAFAIPDEYPTTASAADLALLHRAIREATPVAFAYTDLAANRTVRTVRPLALVHPPHGVKLLAWCQTRGDYRQFFVREMSDLAIRPGNFCAERLALLHGLLARDLLRT